MRVIIIQASTMPNDQKLSHGHWRPTLGCNNDVQASWLGQNSRAGGPWLQRTTWRNRTPRSGTRASYWPVTHSTSAVASGRHSRTKLIGQAQSAVTGRIPRLPVSGETPPSRSARSGGQSPPPRLPRPPAPVPVPHYRASAARVSGVGQEAGSAPLGKGCLT